MDESAPLLGSSSRGTELNTSAVAQNSSQPRHGIPDLDDRLHRWKAAIAARFSSKGKARQRDPTIPTGPVALISVFHRIEASGPGYHADSLGPTSDTALDIDERVEEVKRAIDQGLLPKMIQTGSSGSYFARRINPQTSQPETVAVFKPRDEEPYGDLNPKRVLLRKYFWWMMGRPCLVPNFSASSEAGASYLDTRLNLHIVPPTHLVSLSSPSFYYAHNDREAWKKHKRRPPEKIGSFQLFLNGYENASDFLRSHPWPTRPLHLLEADLAAERAAHRLSRRKQKAYLRRCFIAVKRFMLCRTAPLPSDGFENDLDAEAQSDPDAALGGIRGIASGHSFQWTPQTMRSFRIELEKLVVLDYLMRNTDRGLDNFMIRTSPTHSGSSSDSPPSGSTVVQLGAIDNSLSFPHRHPNGLRDYPFGWLWLPADLIGQPFSQETRNHFLPLLTDASWWIETVAGLRKIFEKDEQFSAKIFSRQMQVMRGQGLTLVESLTHPREGPIELCARPRQIVPEQVVRMTYKELQRAYQESSTTVLLPRGTEHDSVLYKELPTQHRELDKVIERPHSEALTDSNGAATPVLDSSQMIEPNGIDANAAIDIPSARSPVGISPENEPRSLPLAESGASLAALLRWKETPGAGQDTLGQGLADKRSMTGIEVLEWEMSASQTSRGQMESFFGSGESPDRQGLTRSPPPPPRLMRSPATSPTMPRGRLSVSVDQLPVNGTPSAPAAEGGVVGRAKPSFFRMRSSTGSFFRRPSARGRPGKHAVRTPAASGDGARSTTDRTETDETSSDLDVSVMSLPAAPSRSPVHQAETASQARSSSAEERQPGEGQAVMGRAELGGLSLRRRMGSVSGWSVTSLGSALSGEGNRHSSDEEVKVIVQRAVHDPSRPFLSWY